jgi:RES domain-containing protein
MVAETPTLWDASAAIKACQVVHWSGEVWRCHSRKYAGDSAAGSLKVTGRFNQGTDKFPDHETWQALYTSLGQHVALGERIRHTTPESLQALANQRISRLRVELNYVLMACAQSGCADLAVPGLTNAELCHLTDHSKTLQLARVARGYCEAMLIPSCTRFPEGNLIIFPDRLHATSSIQVLDSQDPDLFVDGNNIT